MAEPPPCRRPQDSDEGEEDSDDDEGEDESDDDGAGFGWPAAGRREPSAVIEEIEDDRAERAGKGAVGSGAAVEGGSAIWLCDSALARRTALPLRLAGLCVLLPANGACFPRPRRRP
jgi:hypothetical protein